MKTITLALFSAIAVAQFLQVNGFSSDITEHIFQKVLQILSTSSTHEKEPILPQIITAVNPKLTKLYRLKNPIIEDIITETIPFDFLETNLSEIQNNAPIQETTDSGSVSKIETIENTSTLEISTEHADITTPYTEYGIPFFSNPIEFRSANENEK